jgi:CRISPR-associated protein Cas5t
MIWLYVQAPFAVCRTFTAGWYRPTATFLTPSAAYGLLLNIAGIDSRLREEDASHDGKTPATLIRPGLPKVRIALGAPACTGDSFPIVQTIYQQLHNYPVGSSGEARAEAAKGSKYNITPVRREYLSGLRAIVGLQGDAELDEHIRQGLRGELNDGRYGLPFLGDNQFLLDRLEELPSPWPAHWFERVTEDSGPPRPRTTRLTIWIDRADLSRTISALYTPTESAMPDVPEGAWTAINPNELEPPTSRVRSR